MDGCDLQRLPAPQDLPSLDGFKQFAATNPLNNLQVSSFLLCKHEKCVLILRHAGVASSLMLSEPCPEETMREYHLENLRLEGPARVHEVSVTGRVRAGRHPQVCLFQV